MISLEFMTEGTDDVRFVECVQELIRGAAHTHDAKEIFIFKIDHWFDHKWLGFSGKVVGAMGFWQKRLTIPPFVANRIVASQHYLREQSTGDFCYVGEGRGVHHQGTAESNLRRTARKTVGDAALFWLTGDTAASARGSLMGYIPVEDQHWGWYLSLDRPNEWRILKRKGIYDYEVRLFHETGRKKWPAEPWD